MKRNYMAYYRKSAPAHPHHRGPLHLEALNILGIVGAYTPTASIKMCHVV